MRWLGHSHPMTVFVLIDVERFRGEIVHCPKQFDVDIELHVSWLVSLERRQFDVDFQLLEQQFSHLIWAFCWGKQKGWIYCWAALRATLRTASLHLKGIGVDAEKYHCIKLHWKFWRCRYQRRAAHQARHQQCLQPGMRGMRCIEHGINSAYIIGRSYVRCSRPLCSINLWPFI